MEPIARQFAVLGITVFFGVGFGLAYDIYRVLRGFVRLGRLFTNLGDFLFWLAATLGFFGVLFVYNYGEVRVFVFAGFLIGLLSYFGLASEWMYDLLTILFHFLFGLVGLLLKSLAWPFYRAVQLLRPVGRVTGKWLQTARGTVRRQTGWVRRSIQHARKAWPYVRPPKVK